MSKFVATIESGSFDTQPYKFEHEYRLASWIDDIMDTYDNEVTLTITKLPRGENNGGLVEE